MSDTLSLRLRARPEDAGERLDRVLHRLLAVRFETPPSRADVRRWVEGGNARVNGRRRDRASHRVAAGDDLELRVDPGELENRVRARTAPVHLSADVILYEDAHLLAVHKPAGLPSHATRDPARDHLVAAVSRLLEARGDTDVYVALGHRLDAETSGVVLLARTRTMVAPLVDAFRARKVEKAYDAVVQVCREPARESWTIESYLRADRGGTVRSVRAGGDPAVTDVTVVARARARDGAPLALVEARPRTGRTHQIRVHLAEAGLPIRGDRRYGLPRVKRSTAPARLMLHARRIGFEHPVRGEWIEVEAPTPAAFLAVSDHA